MQSRTSKSKQEPKQSKQHSKHEAKPETKKHSSASVSAAKSAPKLAQPVASKPAQPSAPKASPKKFDAVPLPEHGGHSHSYAAHLGGPMHAHTAPAITFRQVPLREPPQQVSRIGKQHR